MRSILSEIARSGINETLLFIPSEFEMRGRVITFEREKNPLYIVYGRYCC